MELYLNDEDRRGDLERNAFAMEDVLPPIMKGEKVAAASVSM